MTLKFDTDMNKWAKELEKQIAKAIADGVTELMIETRSKARKSGIDQRTPRLNISAFHRKPR